MADGFTIELHGESALASAFRSVSGTMASKTKAASLVTANNIVREARQRVARATGATAEGIGFIETKDGTGYVVIAQDYERRRDGTNKITAKHIPLWLEAGIKKGKPGSHSQEPRPFFWPSVELEFGPHVERINAALGDSIESEGLG